MSKNIPAYPSGESYTTFNNATGVTSKHSKSPLHNGMTLRDHFAGLAMQSLINVYVNTGNEMVTDDRYLAGWAYKKADAMLAERDKKYE